MATQSPYKKYNRGQRLANVETNFTSGMMYSEGAIPDGYVKTLVNFDFTSDGKAALKPRAALSAKEFIVPDMEVVHQDVTPSFNSEDVTIKYVKECYEDGNKYRQIILGAPSYSAGQLSDQGRLWVITSPDVSDASDDISLAEGKMNYATVDQTKQTSGVTASFYNTGLSQIHDQQLVPDAKTSFPIGTFLGNSFYFFSQYGSGSLRKTAFSTDRFFFQNAITPKVPDASEAVLYGYNMLSHTPYVFEDKTGDASSFITQGIIPYNKRFSGSSDTSPNILLKPKSGESVTFRCYYNVPSTGTFRVVWSWKTVSSSDNWETFGTQSGLTSSNKIVLQASLAVPAKQILVRCSVYRSSGDDTVVENAMTVGFDFRRNQKDSTLGALPEPYDLSTASGMTSWKGRLVVWGVTSDPTILFMSEMDQPEYFPYPNNTVMFDEPIVAVTELMDNLVVFTSSKVYQVTVGEDGVSWNSTVIQSNLYIEPWDKHLIQPIRNMVYFKSGNYYYMIVPKAQSTTGELTLAPITTPITDFFNHFSANVQKLFKDCFKNLDANGALRQPVPEELVTYYNFVDYESVHNFYVYRYPENNSYVHFDIIYNVVGRYWKVCVYENSHFLFPFRNDATQEGNLACTSLIQVRDIDALEEESGESGESGASEDVTPETVTKRLVQVFKFDALSVEDVYIPTDAVFDYDSDVSDIQVVVDGETLIIPTQFATISDEDLTLDTEIVRVKDLKFEKLYLYANNFVGGFSQSDFAVSLDAAVETLRNITVFPNVQFLDSGYRDANTFINKRYRELQLLINNIDNVDMEFGMDFQISGEPRNTDFLYEVSQVINEMRQDEGIVYIDATPYMPIPYITEYEERWGEVQRPNMWIIDRNPPEEDIDISFWKVRASISGKGVAPRLRLYTKKQFNYQLLGISWIYREMYMR